MSGGHYNYGYMKLMELREAIENDVYLQSEPPKVLEIMERVAKDLLAIQVMARSLEWYMSGDTEEDSLIQNYEQYLKKIEAINERH